MGLQLEVQDTQAKAAVAHREADEARNRQQHVLQAVLLQQRVAQQRQAAENAELRRFLEAKTGQPASSSGDGMVDKDRYEWTHKGIEKLVSQGGYDAYGQPREGDAALQRVVTYLKGRGDLMWMLEDGWLKDRQQAVEAEVKEL